MSISYEAFMCTASSDFKCNLRRIEDYPQLFGYTRRLLHYPGILETVDLWQIQQHYYYSHETINPSRVVPLGPDMRAYANPTVDESAIPSESPQSINLLYDE